jgi:hypothetical protein
MNACMTGPTDGSHGVCSGNMVHTGPHHAVAQMLHVLLQAEVFELKRMASRLWIRNWPRQK